MQGKEEMLKHNAPPRPLALSGSLALFGIPTLAMWLATRWGIPFLRERLAGPDIVCWFIAGGSVFFCLFIAAFIAFSTEKRRGLTTGFAERFRFRRISFADLLWSFGTLLVCGMLAGGIFVSWETTSQILPIGKPDLSPPFIQMEALTRETFWVLAAWVPLFFFNIVGEELWWRGYMLPRQEQQHGKAAWLVHGLGLGLFHLPLGVGLTIILTPFLFGLPWIVQKRRNIWTGVIVHGVLNGGGFLAVAMGLA